RSSDLTVFTDLFITGFRNLTHFYIMVFGAGKMMQCRVVFLFSNEPEIDVDILNIILNDDGQFLITARYSFRDEFLLKYIFCEYFDIFRNQYIVDVPARFFHAACTAGNIILDDMRTFFQKNFNNISEAQNLVYRIAFGPS